MNTSQRLVSTLLRGTRGYKTTPVVRGFDRFTYLGNMKIPDLGPRQYQQIRNWIPSAATYGLCTTLLIFYFTDWKVVCDYIPFYRGKYHDDDNE